VTPAQVGYGGFSRTIWQMVALWDGRLVGHGAAVRKMAAKNMASEVQSLTPHTLKSPFITGWGSLPSLLSFFS
jgi:hypothetical protein